MLTVDGLTKRYALDASGVLALDKFSIDVKPGEFLTFLGPSGCGKSTALRCIAGLEQPDQGIIRIGERTVYSSSQNILLPAHQRDYAMVFQSYAIWPHMTVFENVAFPLRAAGVREQELTKRTLDALEIVGLGPMADRSATLLSGGQQQRVALARAVVRNAKLLLLDEPLSNLDAELRLAMRRELRDLQQQLGVTTIYVTHDQDEALSLSDRIVVMKSGRIVEIGTPQQLYLEPKSAFTARFIGQSDLITAEVLRNDGESKLLKTGMGELRAGVGTLPAAAKEAALLVRPEHIELHPVGVPSRGGVNQFQGVIREARFSGKIVEYSVDVGEGSLRAQALSTRVWEPGDRVVVQIQENRCVVMTSEVFAAA